MSLTLSLLTLALLQLLAGISPGPSLVLVSSFSASVSRAASIFVVVGVLLATTVWACVAALGMDIVLKQFPQYFGVIRLLGAAYLLWLGYEMIHGAVNKKSASITSAARRNVSPGKAVAVGFYVNITNPKTVAYYSSLFVALLPPNASFMVSASFVFVAVFVSAIWWLFVACLFSTKRVRSIVSRFSRRIEFVMGSALVILGLKLAVGRQ